MVAAGAAVGASDDDDCHAARHTPAQCQKSNTKKHTLARDKHTPELIESISNLPQLIVPLNTGRHGEKDLTTETFWRPLRWRFVAHNN